MKKMIVLFISASLLLFSSAHVDSSIDLRIDINNGQNITTVTGELLKINDEPCIITSLFPDHIIETDQIATILIDSQTPFQFLNPVSFQNAIQRLDNEILQWIDNLPAEKNTGVFYGDLFEKAYQKSTSKFSLDHFKQYLHNKSDLNYPQTSHDVNEQKSYVFLLSLLLKQIDLPTDTDYYQVNSARYDNGKYLVFNILRDDDVIMTISVDRSEEYKMKTVIAYNEDNHRRVIKNEITYTDTKTESLEKHFVISEKKDSDLYKSDPIYTTTLGIYHDNNDKNVLNLQFLGAKQKNAFTISCDISDDSITGKALFAEHGLINADIELKMGDGSLFQPFSEQLIIRRSDTDRQSKMMRLIMHGLAPLVNDNLLFLPVEYRDFINELIAE